MVLMPPVFGKKAPVLPSSSLYPGKPENECHTQSDDYQYGKVNNRLRFACLCFVRQ